MTHTRRKIRLQEAHAKRERAINNVKRKGDGVTIGEHKRFENKLANIDNSNSRLAEDQRKFRQRRDFRRFLDDRMEIFIEETSVKMDATLFRNKFIQASRFCHFRVEHQRKSRGAVEDFRQNVCFFCNLVLRDKQMALYHSREASFMCGR